MIEINEELPEDDSEAFLEIEKRARALYITAYQDSDNWLAVRTAQFDYFNIVLAAAMELDVHTLSSFEIVLATSDEFEDVFAHFYAAAQRAVIQFSVGRARRPNRYSVELDPGTKSKIHDLIGKIKQVLEASPDLTEAKKNALLHHLNEFAAEVDRRRTRFDVALYQIVKLSTVGGEIAERLMPWKRFLQPIVDLISVAKSAEEALRLPATKEPPRLAPPAKVKSKEPKAATKPPIKESFELDDEIPF